LTTISNGRRSLPWWKKTGRLQAGSSCRCERRRSTQEQATKGLARSCVELKSTNLNKKRYSVSLIIDDVHIDKKNLPVNEPVFFHQGNDRRPLEMVVNQVGQG